VSLERVPLILSDVYNLSIKERPKPEEEGEEDISY